MTSINVKTNGASITVKSDGKITSGMVGLPVVIEYDSSWNNLIKTAFFRVGKQIRKRSSIRNSTTVPWEVLRNHGKPLEIGIEGRDADGNIVMPTIWASVSMVYQGASGEVPAAPNPDSADFPSGGGSDGKDGVTFYPTVSEDGIISWTNDGGLQNPEPVNIKGEDGANGTDGQDGYTPVKGTDYWTESDKAEMVADVISALPIYNGEVVE